MWGTLKKGKKECKKMGCYYLHINYKSTQIKLINKIKSKERAGGFKTFLRHSGGRHFRGVS